MAKQPPLIGMKQLRKALVKEFPATLLRNMRQEMENKADDFVNDLKIRAPVYDGDQTERKWNGKVYPIIKGALRDSIGWTWGAPPTGAVTLGASKGSSRKGIARITVYAGGTHLDVFYTRWVEFGTAEWAGSPFFFATYRDHKRRIRAGMSRQMRKTIRQFNK